MLYSYVMRRACRNDVFEQMKKKNLLVAYVCGNFGDDLFIKLICERYPKEKFILCGEKIFKDYYRDIKNLSYVCMDSNIIKLITYMQNKLTRHFVYREKRIINFWAKYVKCNILVTGSMYVETKTRLKELIMEKPFYERKPYILGCNYGPFQTDAFYKKCFEYFQLAKCVSFRDIQSYELFKEIKCVQYAPDIVFNLTEQCNNNGSVVISVMDLDTVYYGKFAKYREKYESKIVELAKYYIQKKQNVYVVSFCKKLGDLKSAVRICDEVDSENIRAWDYEKEGMDSTLEIFKNCDTVIALRHHSLVLAIAFGKKVLPIAYHIKMKNLLDDIGINGENFWMSKMIEENMEMLLHNYIIDVDIQTRLAIKQETEKHFELLDQELLII